MITHPSILILLEGISIIKYSFIGYCYMSQTMLGISRFFSWEETDTIIIKKLNATGCYENIYRGPSAAEGIRLDFSEKILSVGRHSTRLHVIQERIRSRFGAKHLLLHKCTQSFLVGYYISLYNHKLKILKMYFIFIYIYFMKFVCLGGQTELTILSSTHTLPPITTTTEIKFSVIADTTTGLVGQTVGVVHF